MSISNKDIHQQVEILIDTFFFSNFTPNKVVTFDDRDPPWMTEFLKSKVQQCNSILIKKKKKIKNCLNYEILPSEAKNVASITSERVTTTIS